MVVRKKEYIIIDPLPISPSINNERIKLILGEDNYINNLCRKAPRTCAANLASNQSVHPCSLICDMYEGAIWWYSLYI